MALSNLYGWGKKEAPSSACGTACGAGNFYGYDSQCRASEENGLLNPKTEV